MQLEIRRLYKLKCRNLSSGVFNGAGTFLGLRTKFDSTYVFGEYASELLSTAYGDFGAYGTVMSAEPTEHLLPVEIPLGESLGTADRATGRKVEFDRPISEGGKGWYFKDTLEPSTEIQPVTVYNHELHKWLVARQ